MREVRPTDSPRRDGLYLDFAVLDHELAIRGVTVRIAARKAGIREESLSRSRRRGTRIRESTLRKLVDALNQLPVIPGAELLVGVAPAPAANATSTNQIAAGSTPRRSKEANRGAGRPLSR
jgi:hypothetical protein